jgi:hypothetical protein
VGVDMPDFAKSSAKPSVELIFVLLGLRRATFFSSSLVSAVGA